MDTKLLFGHQNGVKVTNHTPRSSCGRGISEVVPKRSSDSVISGSVNTHNITREGRRGNRKNNGNVLVRKAHKR